MTDIQAPRKSAESLADRERRRNGYRTRALARAEWAGRSMRCNGHDGVVPPDMIEHWRCEGIGRDSISDCLCPCHDPAAGTTRTAAEKGTAE